MEPHFTTTGGSTAEAERWLGIAEKLLAGRDLIGSKTFAIRAREAEPRLEAADQILAVADTLIAGEKRINNNQPDWYAILQLPLQTRDSGLIATQYRRLAILLNPHRNHLPFADEAFKLVYDAWSVLFDPAKKTIYDSELNFFSKLDSGAAAASRGVPDPLHPLHHYKQPEQPQPPQQQAVRESPRNYNFNNEESENPNINEDENNNNNNDDDDNNPNFWTACPYCYNIYEYQRIYKDCSLRCQNCQRAFHGAKIPVPPSIDQGIEAYFSCWGFFPLGLTKANPPEKNKSGVPNWAPFSPFFTCPQFMVKKPKKSWVIIDEDDVFVDVSESSEESDDEWGSTKKKKKKKKKAKRMKRKKDLDAKFVRKSQGEKVKNVGGVSGGELQGGPAMQEFVVAPSVSSAGTSRKVGASSVKKQTGKAPKEWGKLDLNVEFSNEVEEAPAGMREGNKAGNGEEDGIEGIGFFEGLDEFLSSLPILKG